MVGEQNDENIYCSRIARICQGETRATPGKAKRHRE